MPSCVAWLTNSLVGGFRGPVPTQRAARIWTIAPHRQTRLHQLPSGLLWFLTQTPAGQAMLITDDDEQTLPDRVHWAQGWTRDTHSNARTPHPGLCFHWVWFSRLPYRVTVQTHSYFACVVRRGQATRPLHTGNGVTQPVIRPHGPARDTRLSRSSAFASNRDAPHSTPDACCLQQSKQRMGRRRVATSP